MSKCQAVGVGVSNGASNIFWTEEVMIKGNFEINLSTRDWDFLIFKAGSSNHRVYKIVCNSCCGSPGAPLALGDIAPIDILRNVDCSSFVMCLLLAMPLPRAFLWQPLAVLTRQIKQAVHAINQSRCLCVAQNPICVSSSKVAMASKVTCWGPL